MNIIDRVFIVIMFMLLMVVSTLGDKAVYTKIPTNTTEPKVVRIEPNTYVIQDEGGKWHLVRPIVPPIKIEPPAVD